MTKLFFLIGLLGTFSHPSQGQSITDLLIQLELDKEKLASMKNTLQEMYQGYENLKQGYTHIRDIAKDNFNLHAAFLDAMLVISPAVSGDPRIPVILNNEFSIVAGYRSANTRWGASGVFTAQELDYIVQTYSTLLQRCLQSIEELTMILTTDELRMTDADRMQAIGRIGADSQAQLSMMQQLDNTLSIQTVQRLREAGDINTLKALYDLPN